MSLRDFMVSQSRSGQFFVNPPRWHLSIAEDCLANMAVFPQKNGFYSEEQKYACLNWCHHLYSGVVGGDGPLDSWSWDSMTMSLMGFEFHTNVWVNTLLLHANRKQLGDLRSALSKFKVGLIHLP